jgi:hypothetical protein
VIDRYFRLAGNGASVKQELLGGLTTFVMMSYIVVVNPQILSQAGMPADGVVFATRVSAAVTTLVTRVYANHPIARWNVPRRLLYPFGLPGDVRYLENHSCSCFSFRRALSRSYGNANTRRSSMGFACEPQCESSERANDEC